MSEAISLSAIADPTDLQYISSVVNQVLDKQHKLGCVKDLQTALKEVSLERDREIQMNLVFQENQLTGFNFSFKNEPEKTTETIPFQQQQINLGQRGGENIVLHEPQTTTLDVATSDKNGTLSISHRGKLTLIPPLPVEDQHLVPTEENSETEEFLNSPHSRFTKMNSEVANIANQLASRNEIDGLWLTGKALVAGTSLASTLQTDELQDIQSAGLSIIKRFQQVLPQQFSEFKDGKAPKGFAWKDPQSGKQYRFYFEADLTIPEGNVSTPASLKGFEKVSGDNSIHPMFVANLTDAKYNCWSIEQCKFTTDQLRSLSVADRLMLIDHSHTTIPSKNGIFYEA